MVLNSIDVYQYHLPPKNSLKISPYFSFEIYLYFFIFCDKYYFQVGIWWTLLGDVDITEFFYA
jgi:hypothetical protein